MSVKHPTENQCTDIQLPGAWSAVPEDELDHNAIAAFEHDVTGQTVTVRRQRRLTQMHDPTRTDTDTGYRTLVEDDHAAPISPDLSDESIARESAREFMQCYPGGDFDVPHPRDQPYGGNPVEW